MNSTSTIDLGIKSVSVRLATEEDKDLPAYDNTRLTAINTCPTWGIVRYGHHKRMPGDGRSMALEAGGACHEVFAARRLWQLWRTQNREDLAHLHGHRLFGVERYENMLGTLSPNTDDRTQSLNYCLEALYSCGFYDDPRDNRRTLANLEECCIAYIDRWDDKDDIWIRSLDDPQSDIGIEIRFELVIEFTMVDDTRRLYRFIGRIDGLQVHNNGLHIHENKTAARIDDAWKLSFHMAHQITGYLLAGSIWSEETIDQAWVHGLQIPLPKYVGDGVYKDRFTRDPHMFHHWFRWFLDTVNKDEQFTHNPCEAPRYTHSCNRYFRPCSMISFCAAPDEEQAEIIDDEMVIDEWNPLDGD